jgi:integrase
MDDQQSSKNKGKKKRNSTRNFGLGTRSLLRAGKVCAHQSNLAFSTRGTLADRWTIFERWIKASYGITRMEQISQVHVLAYGEHLNKRVGQNELKSSTAQLYLSAVNSILRQATQGQWQSISPTKDCSIPKRQHLPESSKAMPQTEHDRLLTLVDDRIGALMNLQRNLGLRFKESALLNARQAFRQARKKGFITVADGTKGGKIRQVPVGQDALKALEQAAKIQGDDRSMTPDDQNYQDFREECYQTAKRHGFNFHSERHHYAQRRYQELSGPLAPISTSIKRKDWLAFAAEYLSVDIATAESIDRSARLTLSRELGHERIEVTSVYIG